MNKIRKEILFKISLTIILPLLLYFIEYLLYIIIRLIFTYIILPCINLIFYYISIPLFFIIHLFLSRKIIRGFIFPLGNFTSRIVYLNDYISLKNNLSDILELDDFDTFKYYIKFLENINNVNKELKEESFFNKNQKELSEKLPELIDLYFKSKENNDLQKDFISLSNELKNKLENIRYSEFIFFDYNNYLIFLKKLLEKKLEKRKLERILIEKNFEIFYINSLEENKNKMILIYCSSNAVCYEQFGISTKLLEIYLKEKNISILLWNYKGYGLRKGWTTFRTIDNDIEILINYIKKNFPNYKFIVHGLSIGGYSAIRISEKLLNNNNVVLICDRTYGDINLIVEDMFSYYGEILKYIYDLIFPKFFEKSSNIEKYISFKGKKIIFWSDNDEMIKFNSSLFNNVRKQFFNDILFSRLNIIFRIIKVNENINCDNFYDFIINDEKILLNNFEEIVQSLTNKNKDFVDLIIELLKEKEGKKHLIEYYLSFGFPLINEDFIFTNNNNKFIESYKDNLLYLKNLYNLNEIDNNCKFFISRINFFFVKLYIKNNIDDKDLLNMNFDIDELSEINPEINKKILEYYGNVCKLSNQHMAPLIIEDDLIQNYFINFINED